MFSKPNTAKLLVATVGILIVFSTVASSTAADDPQAGEVRRNPIDRLEYAWIPPGTFQMGCVPGDSACSGDEKPRHRVTISKGFWMGRTEVTVAAYERFARATGESMPAATKCNPDWREKDHPINRVTWDDAKTYCEWAGGRLPTEAEWEYAARGGKEGLIYPWGNSLSHEQANLPGTGAKDRWGNTSPVGSFSANGYNLFDVAGNVLEWTADWYNGGYYAGSSTTDPSGPASGSFRVVRGGSWFTHGPGYLRSTIRIRCVPEFSIYYLGFRCALEVFP